MKYRIFGQNSGLRVSTLALGTGNFGTVWPFGSTKEEAKLVFDRYAEAGGNFTQTLLDDIAKQDFTNLFFFTGC